MRRHNHYVPQLYLKRWSLDGHRIQCYRILASDSKVPLWTRQSIRSVAYHTDLYTRQSHGGETDEFERRLADEFENPATEAFNKAVSQQALSDGEWRQLVRYAVAQSLRTPAWFLKNRDKWIREMPQTLQETLQRAVSMLEEAKKEGKPLPEAQNEVSELLQIRVSTERLPDSKLAVIKAEMDVGRNTWLYAMKRLLKPTGTVERIVQFGHRWRILSGPAGFRWVTSDDPVMVLNYHSRGQCDFGGGWGNPGSEVLFPISPKCILYTKVGDENPCNGKITYEDAREIQRLIIEHAHRWVFAEQPLDDIETIRPRFVDASDFTSEEEEWRHWHEYQSTVE